MACLLAGVSLIGVCLLAGVSLTGVCRPIKFVPFYSVSRLPKYLVGSGSQFLDFKKLLKINFHNNYGQVVVLICAVVIEI